MNIFYILDSLKRFHFLWKSFQIFWKTFQTIWTFKPTLKFLLLWKSFQKVWKLPAQYRFILWWKNSFQTHINFLDCLEKFPVLWKSLQKFWKTFQTIFFFIISWKTAFKPTSIFYIVWKISIPMEKFQKNLENFPDNMNLLFPKKESSTNTLTF